MAFEGYQGVFVFAQQDDGVLNNVALELLGKARELADARHEDVSAVLLGQNVAGLADELAAYGADHVILVEDEALATYSTEPYTHAVSTIINTYKPEIMLYGATALGRDLAPRISARVHTGLTADCTKLEIEEESGLLLMTRPAFGGNIMATIKCPEFRPQMSTVRPGVMQKQLCREGAKADILRPEINFQKNDLWYEIVNCVKKEAATKDIQAAKILVAGGRGVGCEENFHMLEELASVMGGAVACSRAVVDTGWLPKEAQVGQTGKTVRPHVYFAIGISGAIQHLAGMEESDIIIAINKDESAPIFDVADYGIVGDCQKILPVLIEKVKAALAESK